MAWDGDFVSVPWALLIGIAIVGAPIALALLARRGAALAGVAGAAIALAVAAIGWERQDDYLANRYERPDEFRFQLDEAVRWAKPSSDLRSRSPAPAAPTTSTGSTATISTTACSTSAATCPRPISARSMTAPCSGGPSTRATTTTWSRPQAGSERSGDRHPTRAAG